MPSPVAYSSAQDEGKWIWSRWQGASRDDVIFCPPIAKKSTNGDTGNKYQKPIPLYWELLSRFTDPTSTGKETPVVCELTGGSGTLLATCCRVPEFQHYKGNWPLPRRRCGS